MRTWRVHQERQTGEVAEHHTREQAAQRAAWERYEAADVTETTGTAMGPA
jgi:hypothetical protein